METIDGLADTFNTKADINTVYAVPMQTSYTIRSVDSTENQVHTFLLNGTNNSFGIHAYALRMAASTADSSHFKHNSARILRSKNSRVSGITIEPTPDRVVNHKRMTRHEDMATVTATSEYSAILRGWKMFRQDTTNEAILVGT